MHYIFSILIQFLLGERFRQIITDFLARTLKKSLKPKSRHKKKRDNKKKRKKKKMEATIGQIQEELRARVPDMQNGLTSKEGVKYFLSLDEGGLRDVPGETSFCGIEQETFSDEYAQFNPNTGIEDVRDIPKLGVKGAADLIENFMEWYFTKPPKRNFYALPPLLWNVVCNASFLAPAPTIARVQRLIGDPKPDGIWGSGTTQRVQNFFENTTVPTIRQFAVDFTELIKDRYQELGKRSPEFAETCDAWCARADRQIALLDNFIEDQNRIAEANQEESVQEETDCPELNEAPPEIIPTTTTTTPKEGDQEESAQEEAPVPNSVDVSIQTLIAAIEKNNELTQELIDLQRAANHATTPEIPTKVEPTPETLEIVEGEEEDPSLLKTGAGAAKKALGAAEEVTEVITNPAGTAKKLLDTLL